MGKTNGKGQLGRQRLRWENKNKINLKEKGFERADLFCLLQDRKHRNGS